MSRNYHVDLERHLREAHARNRFGSVRSLTAQGVGNDLAAKAKPVKAKKASTTKKTAAKKTAAKKTVAKKPAAKKTAAKKATAKR